MHTRPYPDFRVPQTVTVGLAPENWQPRLPDHLYVAFTNVVAFSPTDTMPVTHRVKALTAIQIDDLAGRSARGHLAGHHHPSLVTSTFYRGTGERWRRRRQHD